MKGQFLVCSNEKSGEKNIYSNKSVLILNSILKEGINKELSIRYIAKDADVSLGLTQRVFEILVLNGILETEGVRTAKKFSLKNPKLLLKNWLEHYSIVKKCKMRTYRSGWQNREELLEALKKSKQNQKIALALHSAADSYGCKNTNLNTLELYLLDPLVRHEVEKKLLLEPQEKGYEVLLIEPYYKSLLSSTCNSKKDIHVSLPILTFLDLYHFPLRGQEQAEFMAERLPELKRIFKL